MNIGIDIVENERLKDKGESFISLVLNNEEVNDYKVIGLNYLCGRFASKEAIMKCLNNTKELNYLDFTILNDEQGRPYCKEHPRILLSISHEKNYTVAVAFLKK